MIDHQMIDRYLPRFQPEPELLHGRENGAAGWIGRRIGRLLARTGAVTLLSNIVTKTGP